LRKPQACLRAGANGKDIRALRPGLDFLEQHSHFRINEVNPATPTKKSQKIFIFWLFCLNELKAALSKRNENKKVKERASVLAFVEQHSHFRINEVNPATPTEYFYTLIIN
jgi:hypothetical protein